MGSRYLTELADWCRAAGLVTHEVDGWQTRARSSGGYDGSRPWCVMWHHTASQTTPDNDVHYICFGNPDAPVANLYLSRDGQVWVCAGGATNTNGKGGPYPVSLGTVPKDSMNTYAVSIEAANSGLGEPWPVAQVDAYFKLSTMLCQRLGLNPADVCTHQVWAPDRKIDPATAQAVQGSWRPASVNSSGSWSLSDVKAEAIERSGGGNGPLPPEPPTGPPIEDDEMLVCALDRNGTAWVGNGVHRVMIQDPGVFDRYVLVHRGRFVNTSGGLISGWPDVGSADDQTIAALGIG